MITYVFTSYVIDGVSHKSHNFLYCSIRIQHVGSKKYIILVPDLYHVKLNNPRIYINKFWFNCCTYCSTWHEKTPILCNLIRSMSTTEIYFNENCYQRQRKIIKLSLPKNMYCILNLLHCNKGQNVPFSLPSPQSKKKSLQV